MADRSATRSDSVFVPGPVPGKTAAQQTLRAEGRSFKAFVIACVHALLSDPQRFLSTLDGHWPEEGKPGRPQKATRPL